MASASASSQRNVQWLSVAWKQQRNVAEDEEWQKGDKAYIIDDDRWEMRGGELMKPVVKYSMVILMYWLSIMASKWHQPNINVLTKMCGIQRNGNVWWPWWLFLSAVISLHSWYIVVCSIDIQLIPTFILISPYCSVFFFFLSHLGCQTRLVLLISNSHPLVHLFVSPGWWFVAYKSFSL